MSSGADIVKPMGASFTGASVLTASLWPDHLAVRTGWPTPVITLEPADQYQIQGGNTAFTAKGEGLYSVTYQWQLNGVNIVGATNADLILANVQTNQQGDYRVIISDNYGSITSSVAAFALVTPPMIVSMTLPTNQTSIFKTFGTLNVEASAPGQLDGFPLTYQWQFDGTNISGAWSNSYTFLADTTTGGTYSVIVSNAAGSTQALWHVALTYEGSYIAPGTLACHLSTNAVGYSSGHSAGSADEEILSHWTYAQYSETNMNLLTNAVWSTNFWLHGVQGLTATCIGYSNGLGCQFLVSMISPRHYVIAHHVGVGPMIAFLDTNNVLYWRTSIQRAQIGDSDTDVGILNADLPPSVGCLPIIPTNFLNYIPTNFLNYSFVQGIGMNQDLRLFGQPMALLNSAVLWNSSVVVPFGLSTNWDVALRSGDSSNPEMLLIGHQLVLVSHNSTALGGPNYAFQFGAINQAMHYLSTNNGVETDYQLTPFSLTNWPIVY